MRLGFLTRPWRATWVGAVYVPLLAAAALVGLGQDDRALGSDAMDIRALIQQQFSSELRGAGASSLLFAALFGLTLGAIVDLLLFARDASLNRTSSPRVLWARSFGGVVLLHTACVIHGMARYPQLYADAFYARGDLLRTIQVVITDLVGARPIALALFVFAVAFATGLPYRSRVVRLVSSKRSYVAAAAVAGIVVGALRSTSSSARVNLAEAAASRPSEATSGAQPTREAGGSIARPNVLVLAADSLRADRITQEVAPNLARLAQQGTTFDRSYVSLARTFPSWATLLTGRYPHHHGVRTMFPRWETRETPFDAIPSRLTTEGYRTVVVSDYAGDIFTRIDLGFADLHAPSFNFGDVVRQRALEHETPLLPALQSRIGRAFFPVLRELNRASDPQMLADDADAAVGRARSGGGPFFAVVFFSTAHFPYAAPSPYYSRFTDRSYRGRFKYDKPVGLGSEAKADDADVRQVRGLYDGAVASIDDAIGRLIERLERSGALANTIVIVTSDHGETLFENAHGVGHGDHLFGDESLHTPLIVVTPDPHQARGTHVATTVRDVDLAPSLYDLLHVTPPKGLDGVSWAPAIAGAALEQRAAFAETGTWFTADIDGLDPGLRFPYPQIARLTEIDRAHGSDIVMQLEYEPIVAFAKHRSVAEGDWKLVYVPTREGARYFLFDRARDPGETTDVSQAHPAEAEHLRSMLWTWMRQDAAMQESRGLLVPRDDAPRPGAERAGSFIRLEGGLPNAHAH